jgi:N-acetyl-gamma-glutamyl-phosphate reductase
MNKYAYLENQFQPHSAERKTAVSVVGARGYAGLELVKLLLKHKSVELTHCFATQDFSLNQEIFDADVSAVRCLKTEDLPKNLTEIVFLATPASVSHELAPKIIKAGKRVIDLSGAFRLKKNDYMKWYSLKHEQQDLLSSADYGLVPFAGPLKSDAKLVANPGCYASAVSLALVPLIQNKLIDLEKIVIDAKSGTTGAGKEASEKMIFSEVDGECRPYRVGQHQHLPEILEAVSAWGGSDIDLHFTTHLLPTKRGISAALYLNSKTKNLGDIASAYQKVYGDYPLLKHGTQIDALSSLSKVIGTSRTHISYELIGQKLYVFSVIDNLLKGAASQAVENLNRFLDLPPATSLV